MPGIEEPSIFLLDLLADTSSPVVEEVRRRKSNLKIRKQAMNSMNVLVHNKKKVLEISLK